MSDIFILFTLIGLVAVLFAVALGLTWLMGKIAGDDSDCVMRWVFTCMAYAITTAIFILYVNS
jgi:hypothetical protein